MRLEGTVPTARGQGHLVEGRHVNVLQWHLIVGGTWGWGQLVALPPSWRGKEEAWWCPCSAKSALLMGDVARWAPALRLREAGCHGRWPMVPCGGL